MKSLYYNIAYHTLCCENNYNVWGKIFILNISICTLYVYNNDILIGSSSSEYNVIILKK